MDELDLGGARTIYWEGAQEGGREIEGWAHYVLGFGGYREVSCSALTILVVYGIPQTILNIGS